MLNQWRVSRNEMRGTVVCTMVLRSRLHSQISAELPLEEIKRVLSLPSSYYTSSLWHMFDLQLYQSAIERTMQSKTWVWVLSVCKVWAHADLRRCISLVVNGTHDRGIPLLESQWWWDVGSQESMAMIQEESAVIGVLICICLIRSKLSSMCSHRYLATTLVALDTLQGCHW